MTSVLPGGFEAYARVLHAAEGPLPQTSAGSRVELPNRDYLLYTLAEQTAGQLLSSGEATVTTSRGTLRASLERPGRLKSGMLQPPVCASVKLIPSWPQRRRLHGQHPGYGYGYASAERAGPLR
jgi:hypothetical protein